MSLYNFIKGIKIVDTHEHLQEEADRLANGSYLVSALFSGYVSSDLNTAGMPPEAYKAFRWDKEDDVEKAWKYIAPYWKHIRHTGYGECVLRTVQEAYGFDDLNDDNYRAVDDAIRKSNKPGVTEWLVKEVANLDHVQTDNFTPVCEPNVIDPAFFLYDLSWVDLVNGNVSDGTLKLMAKHLGLGREVENIDDLEAGMDALFEAYGARAIAVKSQHAYGRTLLWQERNPEDVSKIFAKRLSNDKLSVDERLCLGDYCLDRGVSLAIKHDLPFKIHTGYYAGNWGMPVERIHASHLAPLLDKYKNARFVMMHISYPYQSELLAIAKHYPNMYVDLCWAWIIDPETSRQFLQRFIRTVPINKIFLFGGDYRQADMVVGHVAIARRELARALEEMIANKDITVSEAERIALRICRENQYDCFKVKETQEANMGKM